MTFDPHVPQKSRYAYAFLLGGALSDKSDSNYRGGLFSTIVAAHALRRQGSTADMILMVQLSVRSNATTTTLPKQEEDLLRSSNIRVVYIPKFAHPKLEVFYSLQLEKFRILLLDEYARITYLDNDILPFCNLDYLMELSNGDKGTTTGSTSNGKPQRLLQDNVIMAFKTEPSSGGFFILRPSAKDYERLQHVILQKEQRGLALPYPHFDEIEGWGTVIPNDQPWKTLLGQTGTNWTWHGANCDQGLLLYWTKFIQQKVSIIIGHTIEHWTSHPDDDDSHSHHHPPMLDYVDSSNALYQYGCSTPSRVRWLRNAAPYNSFTHLTGRSKPWHGNLTEYQHAMTIKKDHLDSMTDKELWFWLLQDALKNIGMTENVFLDFISSETRQPAVGRAPSFAQMALFLRYKSKHGWKQYEYEKEEEEDDDNDSFSSAVRHNEQDDNKHLQQPVTDRNNSNNDDQWHSKQKYAYAFLLGGARSEKPGSDYRGGLYSVVVAAHLLRKHGSQADVVLMVQISAETDHTALPDQEEKLLQMVGIKIVYIPKFSSPKYECFYSLMMEKFRVLSLTEYKRVMYLDYDVMPRCNMDYLFHLSDPSPTSLRLSEEKESRRRRFFRLKENVGVAFKSDPANGGIFILTPNADDFQHIQRIIHQKEVDALKLPFPHWNETIGWGHVIQSPDIWRSLWGRNGTSWSWYGAVADQGLLYYWIKYVKKSVSLIIKHEVEQWEANEHGVLEREEDLNGNALDQYGCAKDLGPRKQLGPSPYSDFVHLTGSSKPWNSNREDLEQAIQQKKFKDCNNKEKWYFSLVEALKEVGMDETISMDFILGKDEIPAVGIAPSYQQMAQYLIYKRRNGWRQYEKKSDEPDVVRSLTI
ncbi:glycosyl transferase family 8 protein [Nitzschia inconspicua]|uniref:Glycosyl transferase family 8 protein n=1 Tax=Nitzschia inconspicua TaxID=303405 RepID=A0A9K3M1Y3_9STRA|nr:glycosyl transferase family 8 protein [Nitzschia inconspicua]